MRYRGGSQLQHLGNREIQIMMSGISAQHSTFIQGTQIISSADPLWQECLDLLPHDFYHLPGYLELEAERYEAMAEAIAISDGEALFFLPYLIRDCDLLPDAERFGREKIYDAVSPYGYPGMLVNTAGQNPQFIKTCLNTICDSWQERNICSAFLRLHPILNSYIDSSISTPNKFVICAQGNTVICDLSQDSETLWQQTRKNHRHKINKLQAAGFTASIVEPSKYIDVFMEIYRQTMDRVNAQASYYFSDEYFYKLIAILGDRAHLCIVETDGKIVAASLITEFSNIVQYHLGGTRTEFLANSPATLAMHYIIQWAKQRHHHYFNLGGGLGGKQDSLYHFKAGFSNFSRPFVTIKTIVDTDLYAHLTCIRAERLGLTLPEIQDESFFPVYRLN